MTQLVLRTLIFIFVELASFNHKKLVSEGCNVCATPGLIKVLPTEA